MTWSKVERYSAPGWKNSPGKILVIGKGHTPDEALCQALGEAGYEITRSASAVQAAHLLSGEAYSLVVIDLD